MNIKIFTNTLFVFFVYLIAITPFTLFPWHFGKTAILQITVSICFLVILFSKQLRERVFEIKLYVHEKAFGIFIVFLGIASAFGINPVKSFWGDEARVTGTLTWLVFFGLYVLWRAFVLRGSDLVRKAEFIFGGLCTIIALTAILQPWFPIMGVTAASWFAGGRMSGIVGNPIFLASTLFVPLFFSLAKSIESENTKEKLFWSASFVLIFFAVFLSGTRGAFVGIAAAFIAIFVSLFFSQNKIVIKKSAAALLGVVIIGIAVVFLSFTDFAKNNIPQLAAISQIRPGSFGASTRLLAWGGALGAFADKPVLGWGPENFAPVFAMYYNPKLFEYSFNELNWDKTHNQILEIAVGSGALGVLSYIIFYATLLLFLLKKIRTQDNNTKKMFFWAIIIGGFVGYFVQNIFIFDTPLSLFTFLFVMALVSCSVVPTNIPTNTQNNFQKYIDKTKFLQKPAGVLFAGFLIYFAYVNVVMLAVSYNVQMAGDWAGIKDAKQAIQYTIKSLEYNSPVDFEVVRFSIKTLHDLEGASLITPDVAESILPVLKTRFDNLESQEKNNFDFYLDKGEFYRIMGKFLDKSFFTNAWDAYGMAAVLAPRRQDIYLVMGRLALEEKNFPLALEYNKKVVELAEVGPAYWYNGLALLASGFEDDGLHSIERSFELGFKPNIAGKRHIIDIYAKREEYGKIIPLYEAIIEEEPKNGEFMVGLAATHLILGDKQKALDLVERALIIDPQRSEKKALELLEIINE